MVEEPVEAAAGSLSPKRPADHLVAGDEHAAAFVATSDELEKRLAVRHQSTLQRPHRYPDASLRDQPPHDDRVSLGWPIEELSEEVPDEVLVARKPRHSLAGWYRGRAPTQDNEGAQDAIAPSPGSATR